MELAVAVVGGSQLWQGTCLRMEKGFVGLQGWVPEKNRFPWELLQKLEHSTKRLSVACVTKQKSLLPVGASTGLYHLIHDVIIKPKICKYVQAYYASDIYIH